MNSNTLEHVHPLSRREEKPSMVHLKVLCSAGEETRRKYERSKQQQKPALQSRGETFGTLNDSKMF